MALLVPLLEQWYIKTEALSFLYDYDVMVIISINFRTGNIISLLTFFIGENNIGLKAIPRDFYADLLFLNTEQLGAVRSFKQRFADSLKSGDLKEWDLLQQFREALRRSPFSEGSDIKAILLVCDHKRIITKNLAQ